jgi:glyoxylase-like metal-dependent hydrolase (beta-lactamase superfamily II)
LLPNLAALGVKPADIDAILMTHLHADHDAGLIDKRGVAVFPRAELTVHEDELTFWRDERNIALLGEAQKGDFPLATNVMAAYADRIRPVQSGDIGYGISAFPTPGHTPGHTAWRISSGVEQLLIWGDLVHLPGVQFAIPEASVIYDVDPQAAAVARRRVLDMVSADRIPVAGIHLDFPGYGLVRAAANGGYGFTPELWTPVI